MINKKLWVDLIRLEKRLVKVRNDTENKFRRKELNSIIEDMSKLLSEPRVV